MRDVARRALSPITIRDDDGEKRAGDKAPR
jgi:hypothetical protein